MVVAKCQLINVLHSSSAFSQSFSLHRSRHTQDLSFSYMSQSRAANMKHPSVNITDNILLAFAHVMSRDDANYKHAKRMKVTVLEAEPFPALPRNI